MLVNEVNNVICFSLVCLPLMYLESYMCALSFCSFMLLKCYDRLIKCNLIRYRGLLCKTNLEHAIYNVLYLCYTNVLEITFLKEGIFFLES